jgi:thermolysin
LITLLAAALVGCEGPELDEPEADVPEELQAAAEASLAYLRREVGRELPQGVGLRLRQAARDELQMVHTRVQQTFRGVPVLSGEAIVHLEPDRSLSSITDALVRGLSLDVTPALERGEAARLALLACPRCTAGAEEPQLFVMRHEGRDQLVYRVQLGPGEPADDAPPTMPVLFIDARSGGVVFQYDNLQTGVGSSLYSGQVSLDTLKRQNTYYLEDKGRRVGAFNRSVGGRFTDSDDRWDAPVQRAAVDAQYGAAKFYDYLLSVHGRRGIDGAGGPGAATSADGTTRLIASVVHVGNRFNNAYWNGSYMSYGDGDGTTFSPLTTLDICGHEMMHGVTERTARLSYYGESGALNESWSDVFGALNERYARGGVENAQTWMLGEDAYTPQNGNRDAFRYLDNPHAAPNRGATPDDDPDHYNERYRGGADNGGVHINSGIANKVFYLLAKGGSHHLGGSMAGIGTDAAARIWYKALTAYMTSGTNFRGARMATLNAAAALYGSGSAQHSAVARAWSLCGVN